MSRSGAFASDGSFFFKGSIFPLDMDGRNRGYGTWGEALRIFFSCSRDSFTEGRRFRSGSFVRPPGDGKALLPHAVAPFSNLAVFLIIQAYGQAFEHAILRAIPAARCRREPGGSGIFLNMAGPVRSPIRFFLE